MPEIRPIPAIVYHRTRGGYLSDQIAPPYDVLDEAGKARLLKASADNIVAIDLPHFPPKTVGPDEVYAEAGDRFRQWLADGVLERIEKPSYFVYRQTYTDPGGHGGIYKRLGLFANVAVQPFGPAPGGGIYPHEQTFGAPKEDRIKLMAATRAQLSPIFGLYNDPQESVNVQLRTVVEGEPIFRGKTAHDGVEHEVWRVEDPEKTNLLTEAMSGKDVFIADGHHRYTAAMMYKEKLIEQDGELTNAHPANNCMFVLVAMQDPALRIWATHRVLGGMDDFSFERFADQADRILDLEPFGDDLAVLEAKLPSRGELALGLYAPGAGKTSRWIATPTSDDPLAGNYADQSAAWRRLAAVVVQHLVVEQVCEPAFSPERSIRWQFPHSLEELKHLCDRSDYQLGVIVQPTPLESVRQISEAGELMPQKSTFFYPKLATGLVMHPLEER